MCIINMSESNNVDSSFVYWAATESRLFSSDKLSIFILKNSCAGGGDGACYHGKGHGFHFLDDLKQWATSSCLSAHLICSSLIHSDTSYFAAVAQLSWGRARSFLRLYPGKEVRVKNFHAKEGQGLPILRWVKTIPQSQLTRQCQ